MGPVCMWLARRHRAVKSRRQDLNSAHRELQCSAWTATDFTSLGCPLCAMTLRELH